MEDFSLINNKQLYIMGKKDKKELQEWNIIAKIKTTNGSIKVLLFTEQAPFTTANFIGLAKKWYYNDIIFHRIINNFMIQWWDPTGTWMWGESIYWEKFTDEFHPECRNNKYTLSMANSWPNTNWSQFFINQNDNNYLDDKHSVFWEVVEWQDNVDKIAKAKTDSQDRPKKEIKIIEIKIKEYKNWSLEKYKQDNKAIIEKYNKKQADSQLEKENMTSSEWNTISVHYTLTLEDWSIKDSSHNRWEPFSFVIGQWQVIKWWEQWVVGKKIWEAFKLEVEPKNWYGEYDVEKTKTMQKRDLQSFVEAWIKLEVWEKLPTQYWYFTIKEVQEEEIIIDLNHELAWEKLYFDIEIIDIK